MEASLERRKQPQAPGTGNGNGVVSPSAQPFSTHRLRLQPKEDHKSESYEDLQLEFSPLLFSMLERHLPPSMLNVARDLKLQYMRDILLRYAPEGERNRVSVLNWLSLYLWWISILVCLVDWWMEEEEKIGYLLSNCFIGWNPMISKCRMILWVVSRRCLQDKD